MSDGDIRERLARLEERYDTLSGALEKTEQALTTTNNNLVTLQRTLDAILNKSWGVSVVLKAFIAIGGLGWLAGMYTFFKTVFIINPRLPP